MLNHGFNDCNIENVVDYLKCSKEKKPFLIVTIVYVTTESGYQNYKTANSGASLFRRHDEHWRTVVTSYP